MNLKRRGKGANGVPMPDSFACLPSISSLAFTHATRVLKVNSSNESYNKGTAAEGLPLVVILELILSNKRKNAKRGSFSIGGTPSHECAPLCPF